MTYGTNNFLASHLKIIIVPAVFYVLGSLLFSVVQFSLPWSYQIIFDRVIPLRDFHYFQKLSIMIVILCGLSIIFNILVQTMQQSIAYRFSKSLRLSLLSNLLKYEFRFFLQNSAGILINFLIPETEKIGNFIINCIKIVSCSFQVLIFFAVIAYLDRGLFIIYLGITACSVIWILVFKNRIMQLNATLIRGQEKMYGFLYELFPSIKDVKCYSLYENQKRIYDNIIAENKKPYMSLNIHTTLISLGSIAPVMVGNLMIILLSYGKYEKGTISIGMIFTIINFIYVIITPLTDLINSLISVQNGLSSVISMQKLHFEKKEDNTGNPISRIEKQIHLNNLDFSYTDHHTDLSGLNLEFNVNHFIAIVGKSGSGKSTIINLIMRLFKVTDDRIFIDGHDLNTIPHRSVRNSIGVVSQDLFILNDTVRNNVDVNKRLTDDEIFDICREAELMHLIDRLPQGIHTVLSERGMNLSGGERQRLIIARCLAKKVDFIIMDEATSALDLETEKRIMQNLLQLRSRRKNLSVIMVTHRFELARNADFVFFLENGMIAESGTHSELIKLEGKYFKMFSEKE